MNVKPRIEPGTVISRNDTILATDLGDEFVMMDVTSGQYFNLKVVGASIWKQLEEPRTFSEILKQLQEEFEVEPETCEREVREFVMQMIDLEMVTLS